MAISCTVVIGPSSGTLTFLRRISVCSLGFNRSAVLSNDRSFSVLPFCPMVIDCDGSASAFLCPAVIESLSFAGKSWYFRDSVG